MTLPMLGLGTVGYALLAGGLHPGSGLGLGFGIAAALLLTAAMLYSVRRGLARVRGLGPRRPYMQIHIWTGLLFLLFLALHAGFRTPSGVLTGTLWGLSLWVVVSGLAGLFLQRAVPVVLNSTVAFEVHLRRIPELVDELRGRAERAVGRGPQRVREFYEREMAREMSAPRMVGRELLGKRGAAGRMTSGFEILSRTLPGEGAAIVEELRGLREAKRDLDVHFTLQRVLRGWLWLHLPVSILLLGLVALHVFLVLYF